MAAGLEVSCVPGPLVAKDVLLERIRTWQWQDFKALIKLQFDFINTQGTKLQDIQEVHQAIRDHVTGNLRTYLANFNAPEFGIKGPPVAFGEALETALLFGLVDVGTFRELGGKLNVAHAPMGFRLPDSSVHPQASETLEILPCPGEHPGMSPAVREMAGLIITMDLDPLTLRSFSKGTDDAFMRQTSGPDGQMTPIYSDEDYQYLRCLISTRRYNYLAEICNSGFSIPSHALEEEWPIVADHLHPALISRSRGPVVGPVQPWQVVSSPSLEMD